MGDTRIARRRELLLLSAGGRGRLILVMWEGRAAKKTTREMPVLGRSGRELTRAPCSHHPYIPIPACSWAAPSLGMQGFHQHPCAELIPAPSPPGSPVKVAPTQGLEEFQHLQQYLLGYPPPRSIYGWNACEEKQCPSLHACQASWKISRVLMGSQEREIIAQEGTKSS